MSDDRLLDPMAAPPLRWGVLGAGGIAAVFARCVNEATSGSVVAVGSRDARRAAAFAAAHGLARPYGSYAELLADEELDAVYVATPHSEHRDMALEAIAAGRPVLVEKAFTRDAAQAAQVLEAAAQARVPVLEAMWTRYLPQMAALRATLDAGEIGQVLHVGTACGLRAPQDPTHRLNDPALAGGALLDMGVYGISFADALLGPARQVTAVGSLSPTGVDAHADLVLVHDDGVRSSHMTSLQGRPPTVATITGTHGTVVVADRFYGRTGFEVLRTDGTRRSWTPPPGRCDAKGMEHEAAAMAWTLADGVLEHPAVPWRSTLAVMSVLDEARRQIGTV